VSGYVKSQAMLRPRDQGNVVFDTKSFKIHLSVKNGTR